MSVAATGRPLLLPRLYAITGPARCEADWWRRFEGLLQGGFSMVQLRPGQSLSGSLLERAEKARQLCHARGTNLILNGPAEIARDLGLSGIHLTATKLMACTRRPLPRHQVVGASCHSAVELAHAGSIGVDFACLAPVFPTASHPGAPVLGLSRFSALVKECDFPVYALGGLGPGDLDRICEAGGYGVAGISAFWGVVPGD